MFKTKKFLQNTLLIFLLGITGYCFPVKIKEETIEVPLKNNCKEERYRFEWASFDKRGDIVFASIFNIESFYFNINDKKFKKNVPDFKSRAEKCVSELSFKDRFPDYNTTDPIIVLTDNGRFKVPDDFEKKLGITFIRRQSCSASNGPYLIHQVLTKDHEVDEEDKILSGLHVYLFSFIDKKISFVADLGEVNQAELNVANISDDGKRVAFFLGGEIPRITIIDIDYEDKGE